jgi:hypothetical protein
LILGVVAAPAIAQVFTSEFVSDPVSERWDLNQQYCAPELWVEEGWYHQQLDHDACPGGSQGGHDSYSRSLGLQNDTREFFVEFRVQTDGSRSEIPYGAPTLLAMGNNAGVVYHVTVSRDLVKFLRDVDLPIWFIEIDPETAHTYRLELYLDSYRFYIDSFPIDEGNPRGPFPAFDSVIMWRGKSAYLACENAWDYIRYGVTPVDGSGDFDSDAAITASDLYFFQECLTNERPGINGGPDLNAGPGCRFADFDGDSDADLLDFAEFQNLFSAP